MRWLIACEESQTVCQAFRALGIEAWSCDIVPTRGANPEWHIQGDAIEAVYDLMTVLDRLIHDTALQDDCNLTVSSMSVHIAAADAEYTIAVVEIPWYRDEGVA